jgi:GNAT superfamily N-acetyltransferase
MECKTILNTIYELPYPLFQRTRPLYAAAAFDQPGYDSVFEGKQPARLFVDDAAAPQSALMCRSYDYFAAGVVDPALRQFVKDAPAEAEVFASPYGLVPLHHGWKEAVIADWQAEIVGRCNFQWQIGTPVYDWRTHLPADARIIPVDRAVAERLDREMRPVPFTLYEWGSYEAYAAHGFGYALLVGDHFASAVTAVTVSDRHALITIDTDAAYRRRGLATLVAARFIEHCLEHGLLPIWDCDDFNTPSIATARKLGFIEAEPFIELALPDRAQPPQSRGLWSIRETRADGVIVWTRA